MELKDFVSQSIIQIVDGIVEAQQHCKGKSALVNPSGARLGSVLAGSSMNLESGGGIIESIGFDISIVAEESTDKNGKVRLGVSMMQIGGGASAGSKDSTTSRIKFSVPVRFPQQ
jgi:hypothetical protein